MKLLLARSALAASLLAVLLGLYLTIGCKSPTLAPVPYISPACYNCIEIPHPNNLCDSYFMPYGDIWIASQRFDGKAIVFKNIEVIDRMLLYCDEGIMWLSDIKCYITNIEYLQHLNVGDTVDVVGINQGPATDFIGLVFYDCFILPSGIVQLPAGGPGETFTPGY